MYPQSLLDGAFNLTCMSKLCVYHNHVGWGESVVGKIGGGVMSRATGRGGMVEWGDDSAGAMSGGWPGAGDGRGQRLSTPGTPGSQWMTPSKDGWVKKVRMFAPSGLALYNRIQCTYRQRT